MTIIDETLEDWKTLEQYWICQFKSWGFNLTNITNGGEGSYGAGQWNNVEVSAYDKDGSFIKTFESLKKCASYFKTTPTNVKAVVSGRNRLLLKKYQIKYGGCKNNIGTVANRKIRSDKGNSKEFNFKMIKCLEDNKEFRSMKEASTYYKISQTSISNIIHGRSKKSRIGKTFCFL